MNYDTVTKTFSCACHWPRHHLSVDADPVSGGLPWMTLSVMNETPTLLEKLKSCWKILTGNDEYLSEIVLNSDEVGHFRVFVNEVCVKLPPD